ncbi:carbohydrate kinase family protein [Phytoactinopolyspora halotolerans]|uniref:Ribokinase n=1 Tax=Phytoactinopolyspora halotolerans TaxID=1981512 RepID=A0A6L9SCH1_9ACTN|nr:PfkB family carbohydrate kinase [Phytoactinopolyspora halotolerans]NEE02384.1 ribokinase [Phytoactinopolyspora halotolerans]
MIVVVGDVVTDVLAQVGGDGGELAIGSDTPAGIRMSGGGQAANTAAWLASLGVDVTFVGAVGNDRAGEDRVAELRDAGVRVRVSRRDGMATGCVIVLAHGDERTMISDRGANALLDADHVAAAIGEIGPEPAGGGETDVRHLHLSGYTLLDPASRAAGLRALELARDAGLTTSVDAASAEPLRAAGPAFIEWMRGVDILFANTAEAEVLASYMVLPDGGRPADPAQSVDPARQASGLARRTGGEVVVKLGDAGALWSDGVQVIRHDAVPVRVIDATGAGDAFAAAFLESWTRTRTRPETALAVGCALGAEAVGHVGAR